MRTMHIYGPPGKSVYWKNIFFISHPKHMLWVLKRSVSIRRFLSSFEKPKHMSAKTRSDRDKLCHFWSKMKSQESQNKLFLSIASYLVHLILDGFC